MNLCQRLARYFTNNAHSRGAEYYAEQRVHLDDSSATEVRGFVQGTDAYGVLLIFREGTLIVWCECPYFVRDASPCKHLWAVLITCDREGLLSSAAASKHLVLEGDNFLPERADDEFYDETPEPPPASPRPAPPPARTAVEAPRQYSRWEQKFNAMLASQEDRLQSFDRWPARREIVYVIEVGGSELRGLQVSLRSRDKKADGTWTHPKPLTLKPHQVPQIPAEDRAIVSALAGGERYGYYTQELPSSFALSSTLAGMLVPSMLRTGRCFLVAQRAPEILSPLTFDEDGVWTLQLEVHRCDKGGWMMEGSFRRAQETIEVRQAILMTRELLFTADRVARLAENSSTRWVAALHKTGPIRVKEEECDEFLGALLNSPQLPALKVPEEMQYQEVHGQGRPRLKIYKPRASMRQDRLRADLSFDYDGRVVNENDTARGFFDKANRQFMRRDPDAEQAARDLLEQSGVKLNPPNYYDAEPYHDLAARKLPMLVHSLLEAGWHVEAEDKIFRRPGAARIEVSSGVDWFELHGGIDYGDTQARLPALLAALQRGEKMVRLDDGTYGMLPEEWLGRIAPLAAMGAAEDGHIRFGRSQAGLLDALLASQPEARCDETFATFREKLKTFEGVERRAQPAGFNGTLRDYQGEGLGWMHFLREFSFGGCLADDMGVGKTAQVLALLETRREARHCGERLAPSLAVVPRSLVFNWKEEAARFTPNLRVFDHTGAERHNEDLSTYDLVLTTYGTLRRDILRLKEIEFDYVVLDESQAIKNASTQAAKAVRLLRARNRLALSGTPIENHLGELWSLFEFLNPGMLGAASVFRLAGGAMRNPDEHTRRLLGQALRPFILRRTKEQVARELPPKNEQTMYCEMEAAERKSYEELRKHYRASLLKRIETSGIAKSKIHVLEALLRLRQAACHPGLIDPKRAAEPSAKLDLLMERLREVVEEGHKALVFSQFTSLLKIVRTRLDDEGISYEYLDGATRDRQARVERFQTDPDCRAFLISLKAGGLGLNLTAAEYVFILDPWWNPAVEAQAMDRAHRIGQERAVFAYRLISRGTVEEKVLELQKSKRGLADAIITADNSIIRSLRPEDLAVLLSD